MKVSGFTVVRNAVRMGYPLEESLRSLLPIVDELVVGVGQSDDGTRELIESLGDPKIRIIDTLWDTQKTSGGQILSEKTNEALSYCQYDWCFYLQADEVLHEKDLGRIYESLVQYENNPEVQGLLFRYVHFYGGFNIVATNRKWYRNEIRVIKKSSGAQSFRDAQGFRINGNKLTVKPSGGSIYHYGWVKPPEQMGVKTNLLNFWWNGNQMEAKEFRYVKQYGLRPFRGEHPAVMKKLVESQDWTFDAKRSLKDWSLKDINLMLSDAFEWITGHRLGEYKPYRLLDTED
jgi:glycosyltransferase involved in cell wall biosynthesis